MHVVPVLFGGPGCSATWWAPHVAVEVVEGVPAPSATHVRYRIVR